MTDDNIVDFDTVRGPEQERPDPREYEIKYTVHNMDTGFPEVVTETYLGYPMLTEDFINIYTGDYNTLLIIPSSSLLSLKGKDMAGPIQ